MYIVTHNDGFGKRKNEAKYDYYDVCRCLFHRLVMSWRESRKQPTVAAGNPERREPGQRDIAVRINGTLVNAASVKKLFEGVLGELDAKDQLELLLPLLPFATGTRRYLLA